MMLDKPSRKALIDALEALRAGSSRKFEDRLWLGFGDRWTQMRALLIRDGHVRETPADAPAYALLPRGEALRTRLIESLAPPSASGITAIGVALTGSNTA